MAEKNIINEVDNQRSTVAETNLIVDGLVCYCVNLRYGKWVEQFVVLQSFTTSSNLNVLAIKVTPTDAEKIAEGQQDVVYIYCGGEWPNKLRLSEHQHKCCINALFDPDSIKHLQLPIFPNFKSA